MRLKNLIGIFIFLFLVFVFVGDRFLPKPLNTYSYQTRTQINQFMLGLFSSKKPRNMNEEREKKLDEQINPDAGESNNH
jgi:hypothetical protein